MKSELGRHCKRKRTYEVINASVYAIENYNFLRKMKNINSQDGQLVRDEDVSMVMCSAFEWFSLPQLYA